MESVYNTCGNPVWAPASLVRKEERRAGSLCYYGASCGGGQLGRFGRRRLSGKPARMAREKKGNYVFPDVCKIGHFSKVGRELANVMHESKS